MNSKLLERKTARKTTVELGWRALNRRYMSRHADSNAVPVHCLHKRRPCNKWFDQQAVRRANALCEAVFGLGVTRRYVRYLNIRFVLWTQSDDGETTGAVLVSREDKCSPTTYRMHALVVSPEHRRRGIGTALVDKLEYKLPWGSTLWLCVDADQEDTERLVDWYRGLGFDYADPKLALPVRADEIALVRIVG